MPETEELERLSYGPYGELVKSSQFGDVKRGDRVFIRREFIADRVGWAVDWRWEFLAFVTNVETGAQWVELWGGSAKWAHVLGVRPEAITKVDTR